MLLYDTSSIRNRTSIAFLWDPIPLLGMGFANYPHTVTEELMISEPTAWGLFSTPGACCTLTGEESMGTEMNHGCSCTREGSGSWWGSWWDNRDLPGTLFYLHKYRARAEQTLNLPSIHLLTAWTNTAQLQGSHLPGEHHGNLTVERSSNVCRCSSVSFTRCL